VRKRERQRESISKEKCTTPQHTATRCNAPQHTATRCNAPQHTATHCNLEREMHLIEPDLRHTVLPRKENRVRTSIGPLNCANAASINTIPQICVRELSAYLRGRERAWVRQTRNRKGGRKKTKRNISNATSVKNVP